MSTGALIGLPLIVVCVAVSTLILVMARRSGRGEVPKNPLLGVRTKTTQSNDAAWRIGQRAGVRKYIFLVPVLGVAAAATLVNMLIDGPTWVFLAIVLAVGLADVGVAISSARAANAAARRENTGIA